MSFPSERYGGTQKSLRLKMTTGSDSRKKAHESYGGSIFVPNTAVIAAFRSLMHPSALIALFGLRDLIWSFPLKGMGGLIS